MPDSVQEQIVKKIAGELALLTTANGYVNTIALVQRLNLHGIATGSLPTLLVLEGECASDLLTAPYVRRRLELEVIIIAAQDDSDSRSGGEILNSLVADVHLAFERNRQWGGLAYETRPPVYFDTELVAEQPYLSKGLRFEIHYDHLRSDPYRQDP